MSAYIRGQFVASVLTMPFGRHVKGFAMVRDNARGLPDVIRRWKANAGSGTECRPENEK